MLEGRGGKVGVARQRLNGRGCEAGVARQGLQGRCCKVRVARQRLKGRHRRTKHSMPCAICVHMRSRSSTDVVNPSFCLRRRKLFRQPCSQ